MSCPTSRAAAMLLVLAPATLVARPAPAQSPPARPVTMGGAPPYPPAQPAPAPANAALEAAKTLFRQGVDLFNAGDSERALDYFLRSRAAYPSVLNAINAAICLDRLKRYDEALEMYEEALTRHGKEMDAADRASMAPAMTALLGKVGSIELSANVDGKVVIDGRVRGKLPLATSIRVVPGARKVRVEKEGYAAREVVVEVAAGKTVKTEVRLEPQAPEPAKPAAEVPGATPPQNSKRVAGFVVGGAGVVAVGVGAAFGVLTLSAASSARSDPALCPKNLCTPKGREAIDAAEVKGLVSTIALGVGVAALATGAVLVLLPEGSKKVDKSRITLHPWAGREGMGLGAAGTF